MQLLKRISDSLKNNAKPMPAFFVGHGSPLNAIEVNEFTEYWQQMALSIPKPNAILVISAHWLTNGTRVTAMEEPRVIYDFGGFKKELYQTEYPAKGSPEFAVETKNCITKTIVSLDTEWGLDHGTWSILKHLYPAADVPVYQLSIDYYQSPSYHFELGQELAKLRQKGVLIIGSGNMVHNLKKISLPKGSDFDNGGFNTPYGFDWALEINEILKDQILKRNFRQLIDFPSLHKHIDMAIPTPDHYYPLLYTLGLINTKDSLSIFNDKAVAGSITMTSLKIEN